MKLNDIKPKHKFKSGKRLARGNAGKGGTTAGRGTKGQKSRSGHNIPTGFEGGQTKLSQVLPKVKGFKSKKSPNYIIHTSDLNSNFKDGDKINKKTLSKKGLIKELLPKQQIKVLKDSPLKIKIDIDSEILTSKKVNK